MMRALIAALAALTLSSAAHAEENPLAAMDGFIGCWRGAFANSETVTDERCFTPMLDGHFIRDTHDVKGAPEPYFGEAIYHLDALTHQITLTYYASDGGVESGTATPDGHGGLIFPPSLFVNPDGSSINIRATWVFQDADHYLAIAEFEENGAWREHLRIAYARAPDMTPPR